VTNDNASTNPCAAKEAADILKKRGVLGDWNASEQDLGCFGHIVQLSIEDFMGHVTRKAAVESKEAIWNYDP
ncbi:hypothetical protein K466DRAFT_465478, partial [Polyporus arcularius HHB13444]